MPITAQSTLRQQGNKPMKLITQVHGRTDISILQSNFFITVFNKNKILYSPLFGMDSGSRIKKVRAS